MSKKEGKTNEAKSLAKKELPSVSFNERVLLLLKEAADLLETAPDTIEFRGTIAKLNVTTSALLQCQEFEELG
jgi:hypothetical protein